MPYTPRRVSDIIATVHPEEVDPTELEMLRDLVTSLPEGDLRAVLLFLYNRLYVGIAVTLIRSDI